MIEHKTISLADQVFDQLESDILSGKYPRGEVLTEMKLCSTLGVSRTPVREALRRLEQEHILEESGKGAVVIGINEKDIDDIFRIRLLIEGLAFAAAAERITEAELRELNEVLELQEFYVEKQDSEHIRLMDSRFHQLIYRFSGSSTYYDTLVPLHKKAQKFRKVSVENGNRASFSVKEHRDIYNALAAHDTDTAQRLAVEHATNARNSIMNSTTKSRGTE